MVEELRIAAMYAHKVTVKLKNGEWIVGKAQLSGDPDRAKIRTTDGLVWVPYSEIESVERLVNLH